MSLRIILTLFLLCRPDTAADSTGSLCPLRMVGRERTGSSSLLQGHPSSLRSGTLMSLRIILTLFLLCRPDTAADSTGSLCPLRMVGRERTGSSSLLQGHPSSLRSDTLMSLRITPALFYCAALMSRSEHTGSRCSFLEGDSDRLRIRLHRRLQRKRNLLLHLRTRTRIQIQLSKRHLRRT